jgi:sulfatase modifying factor 1
MTGRRLDLGWLGRQPRGTLLIVAGAICVLGLGLGGVRCAANSSANGRSPSMVTVDSAGECDGCGDAGVPDVWPPLDVAPPVLTRPDCTNCVGGWCRVPAGTFAMGASSTEPTRAAVSEDQVIVTLTHAFEISQYEATVAEWTALGLPLSTQPKEPTGCAGAQCPVYATWYDALRYANAKSRAHTPSLPPCYQLTGCSTDGGFGMICSAAVETGSLYDCKGYRIPTEAEWEYTCRAGTTTAFYDGDFTVSSVPPGANIFAASYDEPMLDSIAWYSTNSDGGAHPVGLKWPNPFCIYDMLGNMSEWTSGGYNGQAYATMYGPSPEVDPGATIGAFTLRNDRGGPYYGWPAVDDCFSRNGTPVQVPGAGTGVRLVRTL